MRLYQREREMGLMTNSHPCSAVYRSLKVFGSSILWVSVRRRQQQQVDYRLDWYLELGTDIIKNVRRLKKQISDGFSIYDIDFLSLKGIESVVVNVKIPHPINTNDLSSNSTRLCLEDKYNFESTERQ